ncbi:MAG: type VII secretion protein EccE, partial [Stackebrandtia sp.]
MATSGLVVRRRGIGVGPVRLYHIVICEVVATAVLLSWALPAPAPYIAGPLGLLVIVAVVFISAGGRGNRYLLSLRRRKLRGGGEESADGADAIAALSPGIRIVGVSERHVECGVAFDGAGWFSGVALRHSDATEPAGLDVGTLRVVTEMLNDPHSAVSGIQLVNQLIPTPSVEIDPASPCNRSYAELLGDDPVVGHQMTWLAVRLDIPHAADSAVERGGGSLGARRAVSSMTTRLSKRLTDAGVRHRILGSDGLRFALTSSVSGEAVSASIPRGVGERWDRWRLGVLAQVCFGVAGRVRERDALRKLWLSMAVLSTSFATISTSFHPPGQRERDGVWMRSILRVAFDEDLNSGVPDQLAAAAAECGVRLWRCDGQQAAATYASALTGGAFLRLRIIRPR